MTVSRPSATRPQTGLTITDLRIHSIAIGDPPLRSSYGLHQPYALRTILELVSDTGLVGLSETHGGDVIAAQFTSLRDRIVGQDAFTLMAALLPMIDPTAAPDGDRSQTYSVPGENPLDAGNRLFSAIELACLDLIGRALGRPVCDLLGGRARSAVPFSAYLFYKHGGGGGEGERTAWIGQDRDFEGRHHRPLRGIDHVHRDADVPAADQDRASLQVLRAAGEDHILDQAGNLLQSDDRVGHDCLESGIIGHRDVVGADVRQGTQDMENAGLVHEVVAC